MTPEEYQRIKEAEKKHLIAVKKLKEKLRQVERQNSVNKALNEISQAPGEDLLNTHEEMVDRLAMDAIHQEARLEIALSSQKDMENEATESAATEESEGDLEKIRAQELVRQMKIQMGLENLKRKQEPDPNVTGSKQSVDSQDLDGKNATGKQSGDSSSSDSLPDKTIGRMSEE